MSANSCPSTWSKLPLESQPQSVNQAFSYSNQQCTTLQGSTNGTQYVVFKEQPNNTMPAVRYMTCAISPEDAITRVQNTNLSSTLVTGSRSSGCLLVPASQNNITYALFNN